MAGTVKGAAPVTSIPNTVPSTDNFSNYLWAALVLTFIGAPLTQNNEDNFTSWMTSENAASTWTGTAGANNPLNNGLGSGGGSGLGSYPDLITSAAYAAKGIEGGITGAAPIAAALKADAPFSVFHAATLNASWSGDHYAGTIWAGMTSPAPPPEVSAASSAKNGATSGVATQSAGTQTIIQNELASVAGQKFNSGTFWSDIGNSLSTLATGGAFGVAGSVAAGAGSGALSWLDELGHLLGDVLSADWWKRVGLFTAGVVLIIGGIVLFISTTKTGQRAESTALEAGEIGAIA